jgi:predicted TPR repeat methyltransferase
MEALVSSLGHEDTPTAYIDKNGLVRELFWRRLGALLSLAAAGSRERVLDFGGGNGVLVASLSRLYKEVVCVDLRTEIVDELIRSEGLDNVTARAGELAALGLPAGHFDTIIAADVLEHIRELDTLIAEFDRLLTPGGELLVSVPSENRFYELGRRVFGYVKPDDHYHTSAFIERALSGRLRLARRRRYPLDVSWLAVFSLLRYVKPGQVAEERVP